MKQIYKYALDENKRKYILYSISIIYIKKINLENELCQDLQVPAPIIASLTIKHVINWIN